MPGPWDMPKTEHMTHMTPTTVALPQTALDLCTCTAAIHHALIMTSYDRLLQPNAGGVHEAAWGCMGLLKNARDCVHLCTLQIDAAQRVAAPVRQRCIESD